MLPEDDDGKKEGAFADRALVLKFPPLAAPLPPLGLDWDMVVVVVVLFFNARPVAGTIRHSWPAGEAAAIGHRPSAMAKFQVTRTLCFQIILTTCSSLPTSPPTEGYSVQGRPGRRS